MWKDLPHVSGGVRVEGNPCHPFGRKELTGVYYIYLECAMSRACNMRERQEEVGALA